MPVPGCPINVQVSGNASGPQVSLNGPGPVNIPNSLIINHPMGRLDDVEVNVEGEKRSASSCTKNHFVDLTVNEIANHSIFVLYFSVVYHNLYFLFVDHSQHPSHHLSSSQSSQSPSKLPNHLSLIQLKTCFRCEALRSRKSLKNLELDLETILEL